MLPFEISIHEHFHTSLSQFFDDHDIIHQSSCPHTPQKNGIAKPKMHHLLEVTRVLLFHMHVPKSFFFFFFLIGKKVILLIEKNKRYTKFTVVNKEQHSNKKK